MVYVTISDVLNELKTLTSNKSNLSMNKKRGVKAAQKHIMSAMKHTPAQIYTITLCNDITPNYENGKVVDITPVGELVPCGIFLDPKACIEACKNEKLYKHDATPTSCDYYKYAYITRIMEGVNQEQKIVKWIKFDGIHVTIPKHLKQFDYM